MFHTHDMALYGHLQTLCLSSCSWAALSLLFVTEFCGRVFTADTRVRSLQTFKIQQTQLCLRIRKTLSVIISRNGKSQTLGVVNR